MLAISGRLPRSLGLLCAAFLGFACAAPVPADAPPAGQPVDGIRCDQMEGSVFHIHQHLALYDHGKPVAVPSDVGRPLVGGCLYWLHTHSPDGIIQYQGNAFGGALNGHLLITRY